MTSPSDCSAASVVLVADDDPAVCDLVREVLTRAGFRTVTAADGEEVVELALAHQPALIVLDIIMPRMDGYTAVTRLCGHPGTREIPVVIPTGQTGAAYQTLSFGMGAVAHVTKPFSPRPLAERVTRLLSAPSP